MKWTSEIGTGGVIHVQLHRVLPWPCQAHPGLCPTCSWPRSLLRWVQPTKHIPPRPPQLPLPGPHSVVPEEFPAGPPIWGHPSPSDPQRISLPFALFKKEKTTHKKVTFLKLVLLVCHFKEEIFFCLNSCCGSKNTAVPSPGARAPCGSCGAIFLSDSRDGGCPWGLAIFGHGLWQVLLSGARARAACCPGNCSWGRAWQGPPGPSPLADLEWGLHGVLLAVSHVYLPVARPGSWWLF